MSNLFLTDGDLTGSYRPGDPVIFHRYVDDPSTSETELHQRSGSAATIVAQVDPMTYDSYEVGVLYDVMFVDGLIATVFGEEVGDATPSRLARDESSPDFDAEVR